jgi:hypothetical protein
VTILSKVKVLPEILPKDLLEILPVAAPRHVNRWMFY